MDANLCRDHLKNVLVEENGLLAKLETLLDQEHAHIVANDVDALDRTGRTRQACMGDLVRLEGERQSLCRMSGRAANREGLEQLLRWCDPAGTLIDHWKECAERATRCRQLNDRNGLIVAARIKRVEGMLNIISGNTQAPVTYGRQGAYAASAPGRMIRGEA